MIDSIVALRSGRISAHGPHGIPLKYSYDFLLQLLYQCWCNY